MNFYREVERVVGGLRSNGWRETAQRMGMDLHQLTRSIEQQSLSFEQCLALVVATQSPELLAYTLNQLDQRRRFSHYIATSNPSFSELN